MKLNLIDVVYRGRVIGLASDRKRANEIIRCHAKQHRCEMSTPVEASLFVASVFQQAVMSGDRREAANCLAQMYVLYQEQSNPNNSTKGENKQ